MKIIQILLLCLVIITIAPNYSMTLSSEGYLSPCIIESNCYLAEWEINDVDKAFNHLIEISSNLPRTTLLERKENYWHGLVRSFIFRFPDDLEILKIKSKSIIQIRSASRFGIGDLGVNKSRVEQLYKSLEQLN